MAKAIPFHLIDVFASEPLSGNPLALVPGADDLSVDLMQRIAREFNQSETTFILRPGRPDAHWKLRSFTPKGIEVFGAGGHNTLGAWWWLAHSGRLPLHEGETGFMQEIGDSTHALSVWRRDGKVDSVVMRQSGPEWRREVADHDALAEALGLPAGAVVADVLPAQVVSTGAGHLMVPVRNRDTVDLASPDGAALLEILRRAGGEGCYVFSLDAPAEGVTAYARFFNPTVGISEDPATGTAAGPLAAHLVRHGCHRPGSIAIEQGTALGRRSIIKVSVEGDLISIAARCAIAGSGELHVRPERN